jgi:hypothetical protein
LNVALRGSTNSDNYGFTTNNATFAVSAIGTGPLQYQWRIDGAEIPGANFASLTVSNVDLSNEGSYQVAVTDDVGTIVSPPVRLTVLVNPMITIRPVNLSVVTGATFTASVAVTGNPLPMIYEWRQLTPRESNTISSRIAFATFTATNILVTNQSWRVIVRNAANMNPTAFAQFFVTTLADSDSDGIPDTWESGFGLNAADASDRTLDSDNDGMLNWQEYVAGTDPTDEFSYLKIDSVAIDGGVSLAFGAISNRTYTVQYTDQLGAGLWLQLAEVPAQPANHTETIFDPAFTTNRIYRLATPKSP